MTLQEQCKRELTLQNLGASSIQKDYGVLLKDKYIAAQYTMTKLKIFEEIENLSGNYNNQYISLMDGLTFSQFQTLKKIEFYTNSKYISGDKDELGRDKPFFNIVNYRVNVATRATDIDVKDIHIESDNPDFAEYAFVYDQEAYQWMKDTDFSRFLNKFGQTRAKYGGVLVKKCLEKEKGEKDELEIEVVEWKNVIVDPINITKGTIIEKHYLLPSELAEKRDVWENVDEAMKLGTRNRKDTKGGYAQTLSVRIPVYEVHGEFPETYDPEIGEDGDPMTYKRMCFYVAGDDKKVLLYKEDEKESPYKYLSWCEVSGRGLGRGVVEDGFEAQRWTNEAVIGEQSAMQLSGKIVVVTDSDNVGTNAITDMQNGTVIKTEQGRSVRSLSLMPSAFPQFNNIKDAWNQQIERSTNTFDAVTGETMPSGTPLGSLAIQAQQAASFFDYRREEAGIFITELFNDWILPFLAKRMNRDHILSAEFSTENLMKIDEGYATHLANMELKKKVLQGLIVTPQEYMAGIDFAKNKLGIKGKRRFLEIPKGFFENFKPKISVIVTKELKDSDVEKKSLEYILFLIAKDPAIMQNPLTAKIIGRQAELAGILSPGDLNQMSAPQPMQSVGQPPTETAAVQQAQSVLPEAQK